MLYIFPARFCPILGIKPILKMVQAACIYAYRIYAYQIFCCNFRFAPGSLEQAERLEQLRVWALNKNRFNHINSLCVDTRGFRSGGEFY
jgi:CMP-2-keto-3-deoxyoctulosonic acid synthetase